MDAQIERTFDVTRIAQCQLGRRPSVDDSKQGFKCVFNVHLNTNEDRKHDRKLHA